MAENILRLKANDLISYIENLFRAQQKINITSGNEIVCTVSLGLINKALKAYKSISILVDASLCSDAHALLRILAEAIVNVIYILENNNPQELAKRYLAYQFILDKKIKNAWKTNVNLSDASPELELLVEKNIVALEKEVGKSTIEEIESKGWHGLGKMGSFQRIFDQTVGNGYDTLYRICSRNIHSNDIVEHIKFCDDGGYELITTNEGWARASIGFGGLFLIRGLEVLCKFFNLGSNDDKERREKLSKEFGSLLKPN